MFAAAGCGGGSNGGSDAGVDSTPPAPAMLSVSPLTNGFGSVPVGTTSSAMTVTVTNTGAGMSGQITPTITGPGAADFAVATNGCTTLAGNANCSITVTFTPTASGDRTASLVVAASPGGSVTAALDGTGLAPGALAISPTTKDFGNIVVNATSGTTTFTISNPGGTTSGAITASLTGNDAGEYALMNDNCTGQTLAAGANCTVDVQFAPQSTGAKSASLSVSASPGGTSSAALTGTGIADAQIAVVPTLQDFGSVVTGSSSGNVTFTVTNVGGVATGALAQAVSGTDAADFTIGSGNCNGATLNPGASCNVVLKFSPSTTGSKSAELDITGTPGGTGSSTLLGTGIAPGAITITPTPVPAFGDTTVGQTSASQTLTVTNTGGSPTGSLITALGGSDPSQFQIVAGSNGCQGTVLAAGAQCTIAVQFAPTTGGAKSANITVTGTPGGSVSAGLSGNAIPPAKLSISPASKDFGSIGTNTTTPYQTFTITNVGGQDTGVPTVALDGTNSTQFQMVNGCTTTLAPLATCTIMVRFAPTINGTDSATLDVSASPGGSVSAGLFGQGVNPADLKIDNTSFTFAGTTLIGDTSSANTFTITNTGTETTGTIAVGFTGANAGDFTQTNNCTTLAANASCTVNVSFAPTATGARNATLNVSATPGGAVTATLSGNALPRVEITSTNGTPVDTSWDFGSVIINTTAAPTLSIIVTNHMTTAQTVAETKTNFSTNYSVVSDTCGVSVASGASCTMVVKFDPNSVGTHNASVVFAVNGGGTNNTAGESMTGVGINSMVLTADTGANFGSVATGTASAPLSFTVTNPNGAPTTGAIVTSLAGSAFQITSDTCAGTALGSNAQCHITVIFTPSSTGAANGTLKVSATPGGAPSLAITGTGATPAALSVNPTADFGNVFSGDTGTLSFTVTNSGGVKSGTLSFTSLSAPFSRVSSGSDCNNGDTLDAGASCTVHLKFSPTGTNFTNPKTATLTVSATPGGTKNVAITGNSVSDVSISPATYDFGSQAAGTATTKVFTVTNGSAHATTVTMAPITGTTTGLSVLSNTCTTVPAGGTCQVTVQFAASAGVTDAATLTANTANGTGQASITAHGLSAAALSWSPTATYDFGSYLEGQTGGSQTYTLTNAGESASGALMVALSNSADYILSTTCGTTLAGGASCTATVTFKPAVTGTSGARTTTLTAAGASNSPMLKGWGVSSTDGLAFTPARADFPATVVGQTSAPIQFMVQNTGTVGAVNWNGFVPTGWILVSDNCVSPIAPGANCQFSLEFAPTSATSYSATLTLTDGAYTVLTGTGLAAPAVTVSATSNDYGNVAVGTSSPFTFTLSNAGDVPSAAVSTSALGGTDSTQYKFVSNGCTGAIAAHSSCNIVVAFAPTNVGAKTSFFTVQAGSDLPSTQINLSGTGVTQATLGITPSTSQSAGFRAAGALDPGAGIQFTITNGGAVATAPLSIPALSDATNFSFGANTCTDGGTLAAGASCNVFVKFNPQTVGAKSTTFTVSAAGAGSVSGTVTGTGTPALTSPSPQSISAPAGGSNSVTLTFTNNADVATGLLHTSLAGADASQFSITTDNCTGTSVAAGGTCTVTATFIPSGAAGSTATSTVSVSGTPGDTATVTINGTTTSST